MRATRLQQALFNFVDTASQFTPKGGWVCLHIVTNTRSLFVSDPKTLRCDFRYALSCISLPETLNPESLVHRPGNPSLLRESTSVLFPTHPSPRPYEARQPPLGYGTPMACPSHHSATGVQPMNRMICS